MSETKWNAPDPFAKTTAGHVVCKIAEYEKRPWPGCRIISLGSACDCALCHREREVARLTAERDEAQGGSILDRAAIKNLQAEVARLTAENADLKRLIDIAAQQEELASASEQKEYDRAEKLAAEDADLREQLAVALETIRTMGAEQEQRGV